MLLNLIVLETYIYYTLFLLFQTFFLIQVYYLWVFQYKFTVLKSNNDTDEVDFPISVIICARNEARNLEKNLPIILNQKNIQFELIVVNDCSNDDSDDVLRVLQLQYPQLKVVKKEEHPRFKTGKKFAATLGIKASAHEILVFTDADCKPDSDYWLALLVSHFKEEHIEIVLGYSPYEKKSGFLNKLIRFETFQTAINYFSFALSDMPYMGVGRNLSYKKALFFKGKGFASHMHIPSGDDDLFVNQNATQSNTAIEIRLATHTWSEPKTTWLSYWIQKTRHLGAGKEYKKQHKFHLTIQAASAIGFYWLLAACIILKIEVIFVGILFALRLIIQIVVFYKSMLKLRCEDLIWWLILLDPFYYFYLSTLNFIGLFKKKTIWK